MTYMSGLLCKAANCSSILCHKDTHTQRMLAQMIKRQALTFLRPALEQTSGPETCLAGTHNTSTAFLFPTEKLTSLANFSV